MAEVQMALAKCGWHQNDVYCDNIECVCMRKCACPFLWVSLYSQCWWLDCFRFAGCWSFELFFNLHHKTCYSLLPSWHGIDYLLRDSYMKKHAHSATVNSHMLCGMLVFCEVKQYTHMISIIKVCFVERNKHLRAFTKTEEYGWTLMICLNTMACVA